MEDAALAGLTSHRDPIWFNQRLLARAEAARQDSRRSVEKSRIERMQRCLRIERRGAWALAMAQWVAGTRPLPLYIPGERSLTPVAVAEYPAPAKSA